MNKIRSLLVVLAMVFSAAFSEGADWLFFIQNSKGDKYYLDMESITHVSADLVRVVRKVELKDSTAISSVVSDMEVDCKEAKLRTLRETTHYKGGKTSIRVTDSGLTPAASDDIADMLTELVCSLRRHDKD